MKKLAYLIMSAFVLILFISIQLKAETEKTATRVTTVKIDNSMYAKAEAIEENTQLARLKEINAMDKSELTAADKKKLREEVHTIQRDEDKRDRDHNRSDYEVHQHNNGIFISLGGGLMIVVLILVLV